MGGDATYGLISHRYNQPAFFVSSFRGAVQPNEYGRDYGQRESPVKKEAKEQATQVDQRWEDPYARAIIGCAAHIG